MTQQPIRHYVVLKTNDEVKTRYFDLEPGAADKWATSYIAEHAFGRPEVAASFSVTARPSSQIHSDRAPRIDPLPYAGSGRAAVELPRAPELPEVVVALNVDDRATIDGLIEGVAAKPEIFTGSSPDLPFASADHWCMGTAANPTFSNRSAAERMLGVDYLRSQTGTDGQGVNVVVVDQGLDQHVLGSSYGGGWNVGGSMPGSPLPLPGSLARSHGMMIAANILKVAPKARLFDLPLAPPRIANIQQFLSLANAAYIRALADISIWRNGQFPGPWIFVNAWGIFDRASEVPLGHYTTNPASPFNKHVRDAVHDHIDVIFAAGNCGQFCPDNRCAEIDQGPGRSIWGANSLDRVLTVGAVRADTTWLGYSSQGPGQPLLGPHKPDLCAASQFCEDHDAFTLNSGTSAACALTAGIVAALRSRWNAATVPPAKLKAILNATTRKPPGLHWNNALGYRLGHGILDAKAAFNELETQFP